MQAPHIFVGLPASPAENNCACSDSIPLARELAQPIQGHFTIVPNLFRAPLPERHEVACAPAAGSPIVVLNASASAILDSFAMPHALDHPPVIDGIERITIMSVAQRLATHRLIVPADGTSFSPPLPPSTTLTAWMHITNACNLRCSYCYIAKSSDAMNEETGRAAVESVVSAALRHSFRAIKLKYAGGEASLNTRLIQTLHAYADDLTHINELELHEAVLSNGVFLSDRFLAFLRDANMRLMISLDGIDGVNDAQRPFVNGRGSFQHIERTIQRALALGIRPDLSITVTGRNAGQLADVVTFALERGLRFNLNFYRENDQSAHLTEFDNDNQRLIDGMRAAFAVIGERVPPFRLIDGLIDRSGFNAAHTHACGAGHDYMVIDPHGNVSRCQMEIEQPITHIRSIDPLQAIRLEPTGFRNLSVDHKEGCRDCIWRYWCGGGCSLLTHRSHGRNDIRSPYCSVYTALYPDAVMLEGLRLWHWGAAIDSHSEVVERLI